MIYLRKFCFAVLTIGTIACTNPSVTDNNENEASEQQNSLANNKESIAALLDSFNVAAANAEYDRYFNFFTNEATFIGTDATEVWNKKAYMEWAKPYFDKGTTWNFTSIQRNIYFDKGGKTAWFDELLNTQMKICRGSGVLSLQDNEWKIQQYVLSMTIPNDVIAPVLKAKTAIEDSLIHVITGK